MSNVDFTGVDLTSGAKPSVDFTKPIQAKLDAGAMLDWEDVTYIGPYKNKHVVAGDVDGVTNYYTVLVEHLRNKPVKPTTKQLYDYCVQSALAEGFGWANQANLIELIYQHLVLNGLIKEES